MIEDKVFWGAVLELYKDGGGGLQDTVYISARLADILEEGKRTLSEAVEEYKRRQPPCKEDPLNARLSQVCANSGCGARMLPKYQVCPRCKGTEFFQTKK